MEDLKVKVSTAQESKEAQELFFELGYVWYWNKKSEIEKFNFSPVQINAYEDMTLTQGDAFTSHHKEITIQQLRDKVVLKWNSVDDANYKNIYHERFYVTSDLGVYIWQHEKWINHCIQNDFDRLIMLERIKETGGDVSVLLKRIKKPITETEYLMQGKNGERLMESVGRVKASQWDIQVGGDHYKSMKIQPAQFALENKLDYCQANAIKYICRHESKNGKQDLEKAKHYIDLLIEHYYGNS